MRASVFYSAARLFLTDGHCPPVSCVASGAEGIKLEWGWPPLFWLQLSCRRVRGQSFASVQSESRSIIVHELARQSRPDSQQRAAFTIRIGMSHRMKESTRTCCSMYFCWKTRQDPTNEKSSLTKMDCNCIALYHIHWSHSNISEGSLHQRINTWEVSPFYFKITSFSEFWLDLIWYSFLMVNFLLNLSQH